VYASTGGSDPGVVGVSVSGAGVRAEGGLWGDPRVAASPAPAVAAFGWNADGVFAQSAFADGVRGQTSSGNGVSGQAGNFLPRLILGRGVSGTSTIAGGAGVTGVHNGRGTGVEGISSTGSGVSGTTTDGFGVVGISHNASGFAGVAGSNTLGIGVSGFGKDRGVFGTSDSPNGSGVEGISDFGPGVKGKCSHPDFGLNRAGGWFQGGLIVEDGLDIRSDLSFRIDHPLDPPNKYLVHTCVESSERKNVYDGVAQLNEDGAVWIELADWFEALNGDFRYQLTAIGDSAPNLHVAEEISENRFKIAGGEKGMKVCWQVTASRKDPWAEANPYEVEQEKPEEERGHYLYPSPHDAPEEQQVMVAPVAEAVEEQQRAPEPSNIDLVHLEEENRQRINELLRPVEGPELEEFRRRMERGEEEEEEST
jgi:hypothetical protein